MTAAVDKNSAFFSKITPNLLQVHDEKSDIHYVFVAIKQISGIFKFIQND